MKSIYIIPLLFLSCLFAANTMNVVSASVTAGETFWLGINIDNPVDQFAGFQVDIDFPDGFTYLENAYLSERQNGHTVSQSVVGGNVRLLSFSWGVAFLGTTGTVVYVEFQASNSPGEYTFSLLNESISDLNGHEICDGASSGTITVTEVPLAITLRSFIVAQTQQGILLSWSTASEIENSCFCLYRDDEMIGAIEGAGTSSEPHEYSFIDKTVEAGMHRYTLSDINYGGEETIHYSKSVDIDVDNFIESARTFKLLDAYPNPFNPTAIIGYEILEEAQVTIDLFDIEGKMVKSLMNDHVSIGYHTLIVDGNELMSGVYFILMKTNECYSSKKLILMK